MLSSAPDDARSHHQVTDGQSEDQNNLIIDRSVLRAHA